ncbi:MAG: hypothetical protein ACQESG_08490, partial [Nanobdellota archaeon]
MGHLFFKKNEAAMLTDFFEKLTLKDKFKYVSDPEKTVGRLLILLLLAAIASAGTMQPFLVEPSGSITV